MTYARDDDDLKLLVNQQTCTGHRDHPSWLAVIAEKSLLFHLTSLLSQTWRHNPRQNKVVTMLQIYVCHKTATDQKCRPVESRDWILRSVSVTSQALFWLAGWCCSFAALFWSVATAFLWPKTMLTVYAVLGCMTCMSVLEITVASVSLSGSWRHVLIRLRTQSKWLDPVRLESSCANVIFTSTAQLLTSRHGSLRGWREWLYLLHSPAKTKRSWVLQFCRLFNNIIVHYLSALQLLSYRWRKMPGEESGFLMGKKSKFYQNFLQKAGYFG